VALVVPDVDALSAWAEQRQLHFGGTAEMLSSERVLAHILADIGERSGRFRNFEYIKRIALIEQDFTIDNGMLTPTMKIRRRVIVATYRDHIESLYGDAP
jgi:long-chain acyl-CoA synthetase